MQRNAEAVFQNAGIDVKTAEQRGSHRCVVHFDTALVHVYFGLLYGCTACGCAYPSTRIGTDSAMSSTQVSVTSRMKASSVRMGHTVLDSSSAPPGMAAMRRDSSR